MWGSAVVIVVPELVSSSVGMVVVCSWALEPVEVVSAKLLEMDGGSLAVDEVRISLPSRVVALSPIALAFETAFEVEWGVEVVSVVREVMIPMGEVDDVVSVSLLISIGVVVVSNLHGEGVDQVWFEKHIEYRLEPSELHVKVIVDPIVIIPPLAR